MRPHEDPYEELRALMQRYARAADERAVEELERLFHPEAEIAGARGTVSLAAWLDTMRAPRAFPRSMHLTGDPLIQLADGDDQATLDTYAVVYQLSEAGPDAGSGDLTLGIRYLDDAVRHDGRWVFRRRTSQTLWMR